MMIGLESPALGNDLDVESGFVDPQHKAALQGDELLLRVISS